jgi:arginase
MNHRVTIVGAPSSIGLVPYEDGKPRRVDLAPAALREHGLVQRLDAIDVGDVRPPSRYRDIERPPGRVRNDDDVGSYSRALAATVARAHSDGHFVMLLGGDCSILLGALLGIRDVEPAPPGVGVVYLDAHADFATLDESPSGSACSMALALAVGRGDEQLGRLAAPRPLVPGDAVAHIGRREDASPAYGAAALEAHGVLSLPGSAIVRAGPAKVARQAIAHATARGRKFWVHFDVDVLDPTVLSATGDPAPGGIDLAQALELLDVLVQHPAAVGMQLTLYDPTLDVSGSDARSLVSLLEQAFTHRGTGS